MKSKLSNLLHRVKVNTNHKANLYHGEDMAGAFIFQSATGAVIRIISSGPSSYKGSEGWEHVSVSLEHRIPAWDEMCQVKRMFWDDDEAVLQFHPPKSDYINNHPHVLHLWKPPYKVILPPTRFI